MSRFDDALWPPACMQAFLLGTCRGIRRYPSTLIAPAVLWLVLSGLVVLAAVLLQRSEDSSALVSGGIWHMAPCRPHSTMHGVPPGELMPCGGQGKRWLSRIRW